MTQKTIKVCIVTSVHTVFDTRIFYREAKSLLNAGYNVTLIAQHNTNETIEGIKIIALPKPHNKMTRILKTTMQAFKLSLRENADIYHFHDGELIPSMAILKRRKLGKVIYDIHEMQTLFIAMKEWLPRLTRPLVAYVYDLIEKKLSRQFDYLISATEEIEERFRDFGIRRITCIHNYPELSYFVGKKKKTNTGTNVIYVGDLTEERGVLNIIRALQYLPNNVRLTLVGRISDKRVAEVIPRLPENIEFKGWLPTERSYDEILGADIGLVCPFPLPHQINLLPTKLFEYMAAGLPVVASNLPRVKEIVEEGKCGILVDPTNTKQIAHAIQFLLQNPKEMKKMGAHGRNLVLEKYSWHTEEEVLLGIYRILTPNKIQ